VLTLAELHTQEYLSHRVISGLAKDSFKPGHWERILGLNCNDFLSFALDRWLMIDDLGILFSNPNRNSWKKTNNGYIRWPPNIIRTFSKCFTAFLLESTGWAKLQKKAAGLTKLWQQPQIPFIASKLVTTILGQKDLPGEEGVSCFLVTNSYIKHLPQNLSFRNGLYCSQLWPHIPIFLVHKKIWEPF
jgi:hypothetical protein